MIGTDGLGVLRGGDDVTDDYGDDTHVPDSSVIVALYGVGLPIISIASCDLLRVSQCLR